MNEVTATNRSAVNRKAEHMVDYSRHQFVNIGEKLMNKSFDNVLSLIENKSFGKKEAWAAAGAALVFVLAVGATAAALALDELLENQGS